ncbi:N-acetylmuramoyl-L-alanine amidase [Bacillus oleivorans]|uniref:N-acetylmuramoyl-L-alanine amidase n=1 Tax=Bacillus oleivorans TaxID=1448271 RepID=A0A285D456_9BACI|nr:cell wall hydrolase [Bacillus oleivorans]SNX73923.1 N-acetylmuramoyl-L-alanine amidase [Bacillus oleivorans]
MKKLRLIILLLAITVLGFNTSAFAQGNVHIVERGDTLWKISNTYGVSLKQTMKINNITSHFIYPGQRITLPASITSAELDLLARLVHAEAKGEPYAGKVAVATVVLNRVDHKDFPDTVKGVIYEKSNGYYAFSPVANGQINAQADAEAYRAVKEALAFRGQGNGSLFFYNPDKTTNQWIRLRAVTVTIGNHVFAR